MSKRFDLSHLMITEITSRRIRFYLAKDVPDSGQEHPAYRNNRFLVTTAGFESSVAFPELRVMLGLNQGVGEMNEKRLEINSGMRDPGRLDFLRTLIIARTTSGPGDKLLGSGKDRHVSTDLRQDCDCSHRVRVKTRHSANESKLTLI